MRRKLWIFPVLVACAVVAGVVSYLLPHGPKPALPDTCHVIAVSGDIQDIAIDESRGLAYLAYTEREGEVAAVAGESVGTVMLLDLNASEPRIRAALTTDPVAFKPAALNVQTVEEGVKRLWVVSGPGATIETFKQMPSGTFTHVKTVNDPKLASLMLTSRDAHKGRYATKVKAGPRELLFAQTTPRLQICALPSSASSK